MGRSVQAWVKIAPDGGTRPENNSAPLCGGRSAGQSFDRDFNFMNIQSQFTIKATPAEAWSLLTDIARVGPCFPGAEVGEAQPDGTYKATFKVKLGPVAFSFAGKVGYAELDPTQGLAVIKASGSDTKGRGAANGTVRCKFSPEGTGTRITLDSAVDLSGSVAQYGRGQGMITDLTQQLVNRFAENLEALTHQSAPAPAPNTPVADVVASADPDTIKAAPAAAPAATPAANPRPVPAPVAEVKMGGMLAGVLWRALLRSIARLFGGGRNS